MNHLLLTLSLTWAGSASQATPEQCKRGSTPGLSLLAHRSRLHKSEAVQSSGIIYIPSYASPWCPCGGYPQYCGLLLEKESELTSSNQTVGRLNESRSQARGFNKTAQCHQESCGQDYPSSPFSCTGGSGYGRFGSGRPCLDTIGNCLYTTAAVVNTTDGCGSRECFCARVPQGQCIAENFPGYTIVQNGAYNLTTGRKWHPIEGGSTYEYPPDLRSWELVAGPGNHACRGDNSSDNNPKHYRVRRMYSLWKCKYLCEQTDYCTGIEYSFGRCEIWTRYHGIFAVKEIPREKGEFTCLRYGWPTSKLVPVGPPGTSHPCRGRFSSDNHPAHYDVISGIATIEECKAICSARTGLPCGSWGCEPKCSGIEFSLGRCELWKVEIESFNPKVDGFTCLKFDLSASY
eukprot:Skav205671  [mRNA]  locus=scaffold458:563713:564921:+ [translate_table: standard]